MKCPFIGRELHMGESIVLEGGKVQIQVFSKRRTGSAETPFCAAQDCAVNVGRRNVGDKNSATCGLCGADIVAEKIQ